MRVRLVKQTRYKQVPVVSTRKVNVNVNKTRSRTVYQTISKKIPYTEEIPYTVQVPYQVAVQVPVRVCRFVPRTITVPVSGCCDSCAENYPDFGRVLGAYGNYLSEQISPAVPSPWSAGPAERGQQGMDRRRQGDGRVPSFDQFDFSGTRPDDTPPLPQPEDN